VGDCTGQPEDPQNSGGSDDGSSNSDDNSTDDNSGSDDGQSDDTPTTDDSTNEPTDSSTDDNSPDDSPTDETPTDETPTDETPTDEAPTDETENGCGPNRRQSLDEAFAANDANDDGVLAEDEVSAEIWERIGAADADGSGGVSLEELTNAITAHRPGRGHRHTANLFDRFDANDDGLLTADEVADALWERILAADTNGDGSITPDELATLRRAHSPLNRVFALLDDNGDGGITPDEVTERLWERLSEADADGDGSVTAEELRDLVTEHIPPIPPIRIARQVVERVERAVRNQIRRRG
jgi:Ca2+-binding EF-hand superfamily protein